MERLRKLLNSRAPGAGPKPGVSAPPLLTEEMYERLRALTMPPRFDVE